MLHRPVISIIATALGCIGSPAWSVLNPQPLKPVVGSFNLLYGLDHINSVRGKIDELMNAVGVFLALSVTLDRLILKKLDVKEVPD